MDNALSNKNIKIQRTMQGGSSDANTICGDGLNVTDDPETSRPHAVVGVKKSSVLSSSVPNGTKPENEPLLPEKPKSIVKSSSGNSVNASKKCNPLQADKQGKGRVQFKSVLDPVLTAQGKGSISSSSSSSSEEESVTVAEARAPDGGWGWVVVFASFLINLIADGITFSFGVFFVHFLEYFGEGKAKTAWIAGIFMATPLLSGPIASFLTDRYGCRKVTVFGSILSAIGFVISAFVDSIEVLFLTLGVMAGFGLSLCYVAAVVVVAYYFDKKRSLATGISVCGSGIGTFIFAPLTNYLLELYGWRGTTLIMAGFFLNMAVCGMLMRDLPWTTLMIQAKARDRKLNREKKRRKKHGSSADSFSDSKSSATNSAAHSSFQTSNFAVNIGNIKEPARCSSVVNLPTFVGDGENVPIELLEVISNRHDVYRALMHAYPGIMVPSRSFSDSGRLHETDRTISPRTALANPQPDIPEHGEGPKTTRLPPAFLRDLRLHRRSLTYRGAMLNISRYRLRASSCPNIFRNSMTTIAKEKEVWYAGLWDFWDLVKDVFDLSHLANPAFLLFVISNSLLYMWYDVPYVYLADHALKLNFSETDASYLIAMIGIINMFGEILVGWVGDWPNANACVIYAFSMIICGAFTFALPFITEYTSLVTAAGGFGFFIAANYSLTSIILVQIITIEKFTNAYGLLLLMQGIANLIGPPLAGYVYDVTDSYDLSFYLAGIFIALSGLLMLVQPLIKCFKKLFKKKNEENIAVVESGHVKNTNNEKYYL